MMALNLVPPGFVLMILAQHSKGFINLNIIFFVRVCFSLPEHFPESEWITYPSVFSVYNFGLDSVTVSETVPVN